MIWYENFYPTKAKIITTLGMALFTGFLAYFVAASVYDNEIAYAIVYFFAAGVFFYLLFSALQIIVYSGLKMKR